MMVLAAKMDVPSRVSLDALDILLRPTRDWKEGIKSDLHVGSRSDDDCEPGSRR